MRFDQIPLEDRRLARRLRESDDPAARLAYADWLEERGSPAAAQWRLYGLWWAAARGLVAPVIENLAEPHLAPGGTTTVPGTPGHAGDVTMIVLVHRRHAAVRATVRVDPRGRGTVVRPPGTRYVTIHLAYLCLLRPRYLRDRVRELVDRHQACVARLLDLIGPGPALGRAAGTGTRGVAIDRDKSET